MESLKLDQNEKETLEHIVKQMEKERGLDRAAAIAHMRFDFIEKVCDETVVKPKESKEHLRSMKIDRILTGKYTAIPCFIGIMGLVFFLTFSVIGAFLQNLLEMGITALGNIVDQWMRAAGVNDVIHSLVMDGVFNGVGSVLSFLPVIVTLFFFLSLLEDSGYMARVAFVMDKLLRKIGLSGRSIVPMLVGFGCTVPGVMASRTLPSERDRKMTILLTPFMSCSAKLPIYAFFAAAFCAVLWRDFDGDSYGASDAENVVQWRSSAVCYGTSELSYAGCKECRTFALGQSERFSAESIYCYIYGNPGDLVPADF